MIRHEVVIGGCFLKPLKPVEGHILNGGESTVGEEEEIEKSMGNNRVVRTFNHAGKGP